MCLFRLLPTRGETTVTGPFIRNENKIFLATFDEAGTPSLLDSLGQGEGRGDGKAKRPTQSSKQRFCSLKRSL